MEPPRWNIITPSQYEWERRGPDFIRTSLPDYDPYRAWSNFEFLTDDGAIYEVDLLILTKQGFWLVETKAWAVCMPVEYTPTVNDLADLLADAMRRPMTADSHRPRQIVFRGNPRWEELHPYLKQLGIEVSVQNELPHIEAVYEDFLRQMRRARSNPLILRTPSPTDVEKSFPAIAQWVRGYGHIEIGDQEGFGFIVRAIDYGGVVFEDDKPDTLAEAMAALEKGLTEFFEREGIE